MANQNIPEREKLQAASRAFEAVLLRQILESAQKTVIASEFSKESSSSSVYRDMITNQLADSIAKSGQFGLARSLDAQWQQQLGTPAPATTLAASLTPPPAVAVPALKPLNHGPVLKPFLHEPVLKSYPHE